MRGVTDFQRGRCRGGGKARHAADRCVPQRIGGVIQDQRPATDYRQWTVPGKTAIYRVDIAVRVYNPPIAVHRNGQRQVYGGPIGQDS